jgi:hypothetical protein
MQWMVTKLSRDMIPKALTRYSTEVGEYVCKPLATWTAVRMTMTTRVGNVAQIKVPSCQVLSMDGRN